VEVGNYVTAGTPLLTIVPKEVWVTANFKEIQTGMMHVGQPVEIRIDQYPDLKFEGRIDSFQNGTGAAFSTLPAENATGNYVKVVQRIPVKITFDPHPPGAPDDLRLSPGLSVRPRVKVR
jgi:membrane fusion protein (multidrug efflux system)